MLLQPFYIDKIITTALEEDIHYVDVTTDYLLDDEHTSEAYYLAKDTGVLCGIDIAKRVFELAGGNVTMEILKKDGETVQKGDIIARMKGSTNRELHHPFCPRVHPRRVLWRIGSGLYPAHRAAAHGPAHPLW